MRPRCLWRVSAGVLLSVQLMGFGSPALAASPEEIEKKLQALQDQVDALRRQLEEAKAAARPAATAPPTAPPAATAPPAPPSAIGAQPLTPPPAPVTVSATEPPTPTWRPGWLTDFKLGGYGSTRFEASSLKDNRDTFTFRRFVLTGDATVGERLRGVFELELERFTELEVERRAPVEGGLRGFSQSIEGSDHSEVSLEQAWVEFALTSWARFRAGAILVPVGRFNLNHDDNRWDIPRRSLVDRGVPVLPSTAAWTEIGMGFTGDIPTERWGTFTYQAYVMNGVTLGSTIETVTRGSGELEAEVEIAPRRGTADLDVKRDKAVALRLGWSPALGHDVGISGYYGRYTPDFLPSEPLWALAVDGKTTLGPFELEGQYVFTRFEGIRRVAQGFAQSVAEQSFSTELTPLNTTVDFELAGLARTKQGYWLEGRYRFFPDFLRDSVLGRRLENPQFVLVGRWEQAWLDGLVEQALFSGSQLSSLTTENRWINRATVGLAYRPVPTVVFQTAFERTWTNRGKSLSAVTNFLPARANEDAMNSFLFGVAFGF
jgi:hypothetical protein